MKQKKRNKLLSAVGLVLVMSFLLAGAVSAKTYTSGKYKYTLSTADEATITGYSGKKETLTIPSKLDGHKVAAIGKNAFNSCETLKKVIIPSSVKKIGAYAFSNTWKLERVVFEGKTTYLGKMAFMSSGLISIKIPKGTTILREGLLSSTYQLKRVDIPASVTKIEAGALSYSYLKHIYYEGTVAQWLKIRKPGHDAESQFAWRLPGEALLYSTIHCSDGTIKNGKVSGDAAEKASKMQLPEPTGLKLGVGKDANEQTCPRVTWEAVPGAVAYRAFIKGPSDDVYGGFFTTKNTYVNVFGKGVLNTYDGGIHRVVIAAIDKTGNFGRVSSPLKVVYPAYPHNPAARKTSAGKVKVTWEPQETADGYEVGYHDSGDTEKFVIVIGAKVDDKTADKAVISPKKGKKYTIHVRSYLKVGSKKLYSGWTWAGEVKL